MAWQGSSIPVGSCAALSTHPGSSKHAGPMLHPPPNRRATVLPQLLAGVLAAAPGAHEAADCVRRLAGDSGTGRRPWALEHPVAFVEAVRFAADPPAMQAALVEVRESSYFVVSVFVWWQAGRQA